MEERKSPKRIDLYGQASNIDDCKFNQKFLTVSLIFAAQISCLWP